MIWEPAPGQIIRLWYAKTMYNEWHCKGGIILLVSHGPGPISCLIKMDSEDLLVVPRGNLQLIKDIPFDEILKRRQKFHIC